MRKQRSIARTIALAIILTTLMSGKALPIRPGTGAAAAAANGSLTRLADQPASRAVANGKIAFVYRRLTSPQDYNAGIYTMNPDGSGRTQLTFSQLICVVSSDRLHTICDLDPEEIDPAWSPDGTQIAFARSSSRKNQSEIFVMNADGSNQRSLTQSRNDRYPTWSPDGTKIAFLSSSCPGCSATTIYVMNADGSDQRIILVSDAHHYYFGLAWSPDGSKLAVTNGLYIFSVNTDGSNRTQITTPGPGAYDSDIAWSPDGSKIAFVRSANCDWNDCYDVSIWTVNPDGSNPTKLADVYGYYLNWSPDGTKIVFASIGANGHSNLFVMNADGSGVTNITNNPDAGESFPSWQRLLITTPPVGNPLDDAQFFVRQHYRDFLNREPDAPGLAHWAGEITACNDPSLRQPGESLTLCLERKRANTSAAFFFSPEFQNTGSFVLRVYWGTLGKLPNAQCATLPSGLSGQCRPLYSDYVADMRQVAKGIVVNDQLAPEVINANKRSFVDGFVNRSEFKAVYDSLSNQQFVDKLFATTGIAPTDAERSTLVSGLNTGAETRSSVVFKVVDGTQTLTDGVLFFNTRYGKAFYDQEFDAAFVFMEYIGYLRRNPDQAGYEYWLGKLKLYGNWQDAQMVLAFILSPEYRQRFGQ